MTNEYRKRWWRGYYSKNGEQIRARNRIRYRTLQLRTVDWASLDHRCRDCGVQLTQENSYESNIKHQDYQCKNCKSATVSEWVSRNLDRERLRRRIRSLRFTQKIKAEVFSHYSGVPPKCQSCGFADIRALTIDHIQGGGGRHRREMGNTARNFYGWLRKQGFPDGYQVLCMNCQFIKRVENRELTRIPANEPQGIFNEPQGIFNEPQP